MYTLLQKHTQLLQTIDRLKLQANKANAAPRIAKNLSKVCLALIGRKYLYLFKMAEPKTWGSAGTQVTTPYTQRAEELMVLYHALNQPLLTIDQRLDILLHIKWTVKVFSPPRF